MSKYQRHNLVDAMLQPGKKPAVAPPSGNVLPMGEMQMILTLDQLAPNPDNPRTTRNPRYDEIRASIRARGLDSVPKVTRDPESDSDTYIFSDGGNTRYAILSELWQETGDEKFWRINVVFKPWPGRLQCVIGHLAENEVRGELTFIEKALGVRHARELYEEAHGKLSVRKLAQLLSADGMPVDASSVSRMMNTVDYLWPSMPTLLTSGIGRPQINALLALRQGALELWQQYEYSGRATRTFDDVFDACCRRFDAPELWQPDAFRDELIGDCLHALPHPELNYDRWLLALEPRKKVRRDDVFREEILPEHSALPVADNTWHTGNGNDAPDTQPVGTEVPSDGQGGEHIYNRELLAERGAGKSVATGNTQKTVTTETGARGKEIPEPPITDADPSSGSDTAPLPETGGAMGEMLSPDTDIEHLQSQAFRLAWAIADSRGCGDHIIPAREHIKAAGFRAADVTPAPVTQLLMSLNGEGCHPGTLFVSLFTGGVESGESPELDDENAQRLLQLLTVIRRLRELQRHAVMDDEDVFDE